MDNQVLDNHKRYVERINFYKSFGYDAEEERRFILEKAYPLYGDIIEVGTGKGYFTVELAKEGYPFVSIDISPREQELAKLNVRYFGFEGRVDFRREDAERFSFRDGSFDIIFSVNTMHHFTYPMKVIDEFVRILTFEGKIIISDFNEKGLEIIGKIHAREGRRHEGSRRGLLEAGNYLERKGFKVQKHKSAFQDVVVAYQEII